MSVRRGRGGNGTVRAMSSFEGETRGNEEGEGKMLQPYGEEGGRRNEYGRWSGAK
jgi:hypothetical protein